LVELCIVIRQLLQLHFRCLFGLVGVDKVRLRFGLDFFLVDDLFALGLDRAIGLLDEIFVG